MKLKISWEDFSKQIDDFVTEGKALNNGNEINTLSGLEKLKSNIAEFNDRCYSFLNSSFDKEKNGYAIAFYNASTPRYNFGNQQKDISQSKKEALEDLQEKLRILPYFKRILSISDAVIKPEIVELQNRSNYTTEQTLDLILEKLYDLYDNSYHPISTILEGNGITLKRHGEDRELVKILENHNYVNAMYAKDVNAKLTINGKMHIEEKRKSYKEDYNNINSDKEEVSKKIDEIISQLTKLGYGQEIIFEELEELKVLYTNLNKKNWGQIIKGKLIDLSIGKFVENDTISYIYEALTDHKLRLP
ncbi:hypothetical protein [Elizabethkingia meningoseptica]|uniref:hypothetical protein n=1 Tax=Elizabethkingia meningoseptica TaxID=238 RepID=UPI0023B031BC|nr:hypothetical protein [Elizabethkingia meningoseptica]MDE5429418.1 hypothetical protein [Elizabethkingia meningoseptica]